MFPSATESRSLERQYNDALRALQEKSDALERALRAYPADSLELDCARKAYATAKLVYLSCDLRLRSEGVVRTFKSRRCKCVLVYSPTAPLRHSLAALLRIQGYSTDVAATPGEVLHARRSQALAAVVVAMGAQMHYTSQLIDDVQRAALPLPIMFLFDDQTDTVQPEGASAGSIKQSITRLLTELDRAVGVAQWAPEANAAEQDAAQQAHTPPRIPLDSGRP